MVLVSIQDPHSSVKTSNEHFSCRVTEKIRTSFAVGKSQGVSSSQIQPESGGLKELLDNVAARLAEDGFSVRRGIRADQYALDTLASRRITGTLKMGAKVPWSNVVAVSSIEAPSPDAVRDYSSFVAKYALENRKSLGAHRNDLTTIAVIVSSSFRDDTKQWVRESSPSYSLMWDRVEFPVLVEFGSREITYYAKTPFRNGNLYQSLRSFSDKWFGPQA